MKIVILVLTLAVIFTGLSVNADVVPMPPLIKPPVTYLMDYPDYKKITLDNIKQLKVIRYTEAGAFEKKIEDKEEIAKIYDLLKQIILIDETKYSCTDNTTIYVFTLNDDSTSSIEIECNWIILKRKHYLFDIPSLRKIPDKKIYNRKTY